MYLRLFAVGVVFFFLLCQPSIAQQTLSHKIGHTLNAKEGGQLFSIKGSNTVGARLAPTWAKHYLTAIGVKNVEILTGARENEYIVEGTHHGKPTYISIEAHGSSTGFRALVDQSAMLAMSSRPIKEKENHAIDPHLDLTEFSSEHVIAIDGLAIIVHPANPLNALTKTQVAEIFSGNYTNWKQLGGIDLPINLYARDEKSGTWDTFKNTVLAKRYALANNAHRFESNDRLSESISRDLQGIGFVGLASVLDAKPLAISDETTKAILPKPLYVATEDYPLSRRLFMYSIPGKTNPFSQDFLNYIQTESGQKHVETVGFISQKPISVAIDDIDDPKDYVDIVKHGERLSINFRFNSGSASIDNKALHDIVRLAKFMRAPENQGKLIQLIGFGDTESSPYRALVLSKLRALSVKSALRKHGIHSESVTGFGDTAPVASLSGSFAHKNQRVEVWVYDPQFKTQLDLAKQRASENISERFASVTGL